MARKVIYMMNGEVKSKNYMGKLSWSKASCSSPRPMFGTEIATCTPITIRIDTAEQERGLSKFWFHSKKRIVELELTPVQWAEFLTSGNSEGVPCTLTYLNGEHMDPVEPENVISLYSQEMSKVVDRSGESIAECEELIKNRLEEGKTLGKTELKELLSKLEAARTVSVANAKFTKASFQEDMSMAVAKAKAEVSAYCENKIMETGLNALASSKPVELYLTDKPSEEQ